MLLAAYIMTGFRLAYTAVLKIEAAHSYQTSIMGLNSDVFQMVHLFVIVTVST
jgi:hypothetical protein